MFLRKKLTPEIYHVNFPWQAARAGVFLYEPHCRRENGRMTKGALPILFLFYLTLLGTQQVGAQTNSPTAAETNFMDASITADDAGPTKVLTDALKNNGVKPESMMDEHFLFASVIWGAVAGGYLLYARKQREVVPFISGAAMMAVSFMITSWFWMSLASIFIMVANWWLLRRGFGD
jgi:hypothetical protein